MFRIWQHMDLRQARCSRCAILYTSARGHHTYPWCSSIASNGSKTSRIEWISCDEDSNVSDLRPVSVARFGETWQGWSLRLDCCSGAPHGWSSPLDTRRGTLQESFSVCLTKALQTSMCVIERMMDVLCFLLSDVVGLVFVFTLLRQQRIGPRRVGKRLCLRMLAMQHSACVRPFASEPIRTYHACSSAADMDEQAGMRFLLLSSCDGT